MERVKTVMEILDKMNFFQGQRAGRELWNDKPFEVQEEDLGNFKRDIDTIGSYIWEIVKELKQYRDAEEQGLLLRLPTNRVWFICDAKTKYATIMSKTIDDLCIYDIKELLKGNSKRYFMTEKEAEQALARMVKENERT